MLVQFVEARNQGQVCLDNTWIFKEQNPDTVPGAAIAFYSDACLPKDALPESCPHVAPEVVFSVKHPDERWMDIIARVSEYMTAGVSTICILAPVESLALVYQSDAGLQTFSADQMLELPEPLADFRVQVAHFFK
jgi:hypothetical protein